MTWNANHSADHASTIVPSDVTDLSGECAAIYVGGTGDVAVITTGGETAVFKAVPVGSTLKISCSKVKATGTTATLLLALW